MEKEVVLVDTSILIDYFRKSDKSKSALFAMSQQDYLFCISAITEYEIYVGATSNQKPYWEEFLNSVEVLPFNREVAKTAAEISKKLKTKRKQLDIADLFIACTAIQSNLQLATLNLKHFERIENLKLVKI